MAWTARKFAKSLVRDTGGFRAYEQYEIVLHEDRDAAIVEWTLRCLANPECEGSLEALEAITAVREQVRNKGVKL